MEIKINYEKGVRVGESPFLECSSKGDKRFSAFYARINRFGGRTIEEIYQSAKRFGKDNKALPLWQAKGRRANNMEEVSRLYDKLWLIYLLENRELIDELRKYRGFSDVFGRRNCQCQALTIYKIMKVIDKVVKE